MREAEGGVMIICDSIPDCCAQHYYQSFNIASSEQCSYAIATQTIGSGIDPTRSATITLIANKK